MQVVTIKTSQREEFVNITSRLQEAVRSLQIENGAVLAYVPHTTSALVINENADPAVSKDIINYLKSVVPSDFAYLHGEGNSDAHIKASLLGNSQLLPVVMGEVKLGTWQGLFFAEFDGPRQRQVWISKC